MIEASFATQYGIRLSELNAKGDMPYPEFCRLLSGISPKTPLGAIVDIRREEDKKRLKLFTREQHRIRNEWRSAHSMVENMTEEQKKAAAKELQRLFAEQFG